MTELPAIIRHLTSPATMPCVLATLTAVSGSSYRRPGARMLITASGSTIGSISGGCLEDDVRARAARVAVSGHAEAVTYDTTAENDLVWGVGLGCHGVVYVLLECLTEVPAWAIQAADNLSRRIPTPIAVTWQASHPAQLGTRLADECSAARAVPGVFLETLRPPTALVIFGAGNDAQPLVRIARELGWTVTIADPRRDSATAERFPLADAVVVAPVTELVSRTPFGSDAVAVVMSHRYLNDVPILRDLFARPPAYIGLLGPKKRAQRILDDLAREQISPSPEVLARFHAPVGLDLGADTPEEVALSIVAEIQAHLAQRDGRPLRERTTPIHG